MRKRILIRIEEKIWLKFKLKAGLKHKCVSPYLEAILERETEDIKIEEDSN